MRKLILTALIAATAMPGVAMAQSNRELRRDRQDIRQEQRHCATPANAATAATFATNAATCVARGRNIAKT